MAAISDGFSAFHMEVDKARANMLGASDTAFSAKRTPVTDESQQSALDKIKDTNIYASVFNNSSKNGPSKAGVQRADEWLASVA